MTDSANLPSTDRADVLLHELTTWATYVGCRTLSSANARVKAPPAFEWPKHQPESKGTDKWSVTTWRSTPLLEYLAPCRLFPASSVDNLISQKCDWLGVTADCVVQVLPLFWAVYLKMYFFHHLQTDWQTENIYKKYQKLKWDVFKYRYMQHFLMKGN